MIRNIRDWVDHRTGLGGLIDAMLLEHIPGGAKWRYVWGSALAIIFGVQLVTGVLLMTAYSPGDTTAWSSVYFIQYEMDFGWLIRGLHHFGSQTMVVLMAVHMLQVVIAGAHLKPREVNWWLGLGLMGVILGLSLTGYLLPWDQKGYYATQVATSIAGGLPVIGPFMQKVAVGGSAYGNHTLTRFFALHVAILPGAAIALLIAHVWVFRRHGVTTPRNAQGVGWFWPDQAFRDMLVGLIIFAIMLALVLRGWGHKIEPTPGPDGTVAERTTYDRIAHAGRDGRGANLDAPADPNTPYPARPEWYFLFLFQLLKYFTGKQALIGTAVLPGAIATILFILPWLGYGKFRPLGHLFAVFFVLFLLCAAAYLTAQAWVEDQAPETYGIHSVPQGEGKEKKWVEDEGPQPLGKRAYRSLKKVVAANRYDPGKADSFQKEMKEADERAHRAIQLAPAGAPSVGGRYLLRNDPMTAGKALFKQHCATCHSHFDADAEKEELRWMNKEPTASDLTNWGTREWIKGLLPNPDDPKYFGRSHLKGGDMSKKMIEEHGKVAGNEKKKKELEASDDAIAKWLGSHPRKEPQGDDVAKFGPAFENFNDRCASCHDFAPQPDMRIGKGAPELTGYGDAQWLREMMMVPNHDYKYGEKNRMPCFRDQTSPAASILEDPFQRAKADALQAAKDDKQKETVAKAFKVISLTELEREMIIRFLTNDNRVVFGGEPISGPPEKK